MIRHAQTPDRIDRAPHKSAGLPLILLSAATLAVSNLMVGLMTGNRFLVAASALLALIFATAYSVRTRLFSTRDRAANATSSVSRKFGPRVPIWVFPAVLFIALPGLVWILQAIGAPAIGSI